MEGDHSPHPALYMRCLESAVGGGGGSLSVFFLLVKFRSSRAAPNERDWERDRGPQSVFHRVEKIPTRMEYKPSAPCLVPRIYIWFWKGRHPWLPPPPHAGGCGPLWGANPPLAAGQGRALSAADRPSSSGPAAGGPTDWPSAWPICLAAVRIESRRPLRVAAGRLLKRPAAC